MTEDYGDLLAIAAARAPIRLTPTAIGKFFFDVGYMAKSKLDGLTPSQKKPKHREGNIRHAILYFDKETGGIVLNLHSNDFLKSHVPSYAKEMDSSASTEKGIRKTE